MYSAGAASVSKFRLCFCTVLSLTQTEEQLEHNSIKKPNLLKGAYLGVPAGCHTAEAVLRCMYQAVTVHYFILFNVSRENVRYCKCKML